MTVKQRTCEERTDEEMEARLRDLRLLWASYQRSEEYCEEVESYLFDYGLSFDYVEAGTFRDQQQGYYRYQISWGGPQDEFRFYPGGRYDAWRVEYWFLNWFDGASRELKGEDRALLLEIFDELRGLYGDENGFFSVSREGS